MPAVRCALSGGGAAAQAGEIEAYLAELEHLLKAVMLEVRRVILEADSRISESIKWKSPTFEYRGNLASINPRAKQFVSLMFHTGALIPGEHSALEGGGETARYMRLADEADVQRQRPALEGIVRAWCEWKDA